MKAIVLYSLLVLAVFLIGAILDVLGLYFSIMFLNKGKIQASKTSFFFMNIGETIEKVAAKGVGILPLLIILKIFI